MRKITIILLFGFLWSCNNSSLISEKENNETVGAMNPSNKDIAKNISEQPDIDSASTDNFTKVSNINNTFGKYDADSVSEEAVFIKSFYRDYITANASIPYNNSTIDSVMKIYCTQRLIDFLDKQHTENELDWDPFLNAQDLSIETISTFKCKKEKSKYNLYSVIYTWNPDEIVSGIGLILVKENDKLKIDYVHIGEYYKDEKYPDVELKIKE